MAKKMAKNIVLLSDGTGNSSAKLFKTNVWRLHQALDLTDPTRQIAYYDDGVGTSSFKPFAVLGGIFGFGLKRNVIDLYKFLCRNYQPGDRIFGFGFSRGAFTIRILMGLVAKYGLVHYSDSEAQLHRDARAAYRHYRKSFRSAIGIAEGARLVRDGLLEVWRRLRRLPPFDPKGLVQVPEIYFVGVWDTVDAYGGPIQEMVRGIDLWLWPLSMPDRFMSAKIRRGCHALALDEERQSFWPVLWDEKKAFGPGGPQEIQKDWNPPTQEPELPEIDRRRLSQVWFSGVHSDIGGGYPQDGLSYVTLDWMMDRAAVYNLMLKPDERMRLSRLANCFDKLNDSRRGLAGYYRYKPRQLAGLYAAGPYKSTIFSDLSHATKSITGVENEQGGQRPESDANPIIHASAFRRICDHPDGYSPFVLPDAYRVTDKQGDLHQWTYEHSTRAQRRSYEQERAWNRVWGRRVVYFLTLAASLFLVLLPIFNGFDEGAGKASPMAFLIPAVDTVAKIVPEFALPWIDAFKAMPGLFALGSVAVGAFLYWGSGLALSIGDCMRSLWTASLGTSAVNPGNPPGGILYHVRTSKPYRGFFYTLTQWFLPFVFAVLIVYLAFVIASRVLFASGTALGLVCVGDNAKATVPKSGDIIMFDPKAVCAGSKYKLVKGTEYTLIFTLPNDWKDSDIVSGANGFNWGGMKWPMYFGLPLRRELGENWYKIIARVGRFGLDEQPLKLEVIVPENGAVGASAPEYSAKLKAKSDGELFLFVNDAVVGLPWVSSWFYCNNLGKMRVKFK